MDLDGRMTAAEFNALFRAAKRYSCGAVLLSLEDKLRAIAPNTFDDWTEQRGTVPFSLARGEEFGWLSLAKEQEFWTCGDILDGVKRDDRSIALLDSEDRIRCCMGRERLMDRGVETTWSWLFAEGVRVTCTSPEQCDVLREELKGVYFSRRQRVQALEPWDWLWEERMCHSCRDIAYDTHDACRRQLWEELPGIFGLGDWMLLLDIPISVLARAEVDVEFSYMSY
ncbi:hypothetical protein DXG01_000310 [Tephrocybe rancida]|nr:hypothetical protein DXG01_000310 [Tephrocybe rancida]